MQRKAILFAAGLVLAHCAVYAQTIFVGPRGGYTLSNLVIKTGQSLIVAGSEYDPDKDFRSLGSFHAGADMRLPLDGKFSFLAGILYAQKGYRTEYPVGISNQTQSIQVQLRYFDLPLLADYKVWKGLSLQGGIEPGILSAAWLKYEGGRSDLKAQNIYESFDLGLVAGLEWRIGNGFYLSGRQIWGILPSSNLEVTDENGERIGQVKSFNRALEISAGYRFDL